MRREYQQYVKEIVMLLYAVIVAVILVALPQATYAQEEYCLSCHGDEELTMTFPSGETLSLYVDEEEFANSVHGQMGFTCVNCHEDNVEFPHPEVTAQDVREYELQAYEACQQCHSAEYQENLDSIHGQTLQNVNRMAPVCTDCHGSHDIQPPNEPEVKVSDTCGTCHRPIYDAYKESVHGAALIEGNNDVPSCTDCHGVHKIGDPTTARFRGESPEMCASCHADEELMSKYDISTDVFQTYLNDFHGKTVVLENAQHPDKYPEAAVCTDCHGVHDIKRSDDPESSVVKENLVETCRKCHPDATANFPTAWTMHYQPDREKFPLVYYVNLFYKILIPTMIGGMALIVGLDIWRSFLNWYRGRRVS